MPKTRRGETSARLKMQIKAWRMNVLAAVSEAHGHVRFVGPLVGGEASVAVDPEHGTARGSGIGDEMRRNIGQRRSEIANEAEHWLAHGVFPFLLVSQEPVAIVATLEASEEVKEVGSEIRGHGR